MMMSGVHSPSSPGGEGRTDDDVKKAELGKKKGEIDKATSKKKREEGERG